MAEILLVNLVGTDRPGLTHAITSILAQFEVRVLDIGQAVIHDHLSLGLLIQVPRGGESYEALKELLFKAHELGLQIRFTPIPDDEYTEWVNRQSQERNIVTVLGPTITASVLKQVTEILVHQSLNIEKISRLSKRVRLDEDAEDQRGCVEFSVLGTPSDRLAMREALMQVTQSEEVDIAMQADDMYRRNRRLVVFDMDSTLIQCEVIDELAKLAGVGEKVSEITERAMQGELDFQSSFTERVALLKGLPEAEAQAFADRLPLSDGAERLIATLRQLGFTTAICSGGFTLFGEKLKERLGIDYVFANELEIEDGMVTGRVVHPIVDGERKAKLMRQIAEEEGLSLQQVIAVGDGANDLPMIQAAGLGIAFRAKPVVRERADQNISALGLDGILYLIGVRDRDLLPRS